MIKKKCKQCGKIFEVYACRKDSAKFCSKQCLNKNTWTGRKHTFETLSKMRKSKFWSDIDKIIDDYKNGKSGCDIAKDYNVNYSSITRALKRKGVSIRKRKDYDGKEPWNKNKPYYQLRGKKNPRWKGGITKLNQKLRHCIEYKNWIKKIFERDNWICQKCGVRGGNLEAHHLKKFSDIVKQNKITSYKKAQKCKELWNLDNGITLCLKCHNKTKSSLNVK